MTFRNQRRRFISCVVPGRRGVGPYKWYVPISKIKTPPEWVVIDTAGDEFFAEAPPVAETARRKKGSAPCGRP